MNDQLALHTIAWCALALGAGGLIKGTLGVGTPLLTVPLMAMVLPPQVAITIMAIPVVVANLWQLTQAPDVYRMVQRFWPAAAALICFTWIGTSILSSIDERFLMRLLGIIVIAFAVLQFFTTTFSISAKQTQPAGVLFGSLSGFIGGISSMFGPMLVIYLVSIKSLNKDEFVGAISFLYVCAVVPWTISLISVGLLDSTLLMASSAATLPVIGGLLIGHTLRKRITGEWFQRLILLILICSGTSMLLQSLSN